MRRAFNVRDVRHFQDLRGEPSGHLSGAEGSSKYSSVYGGCSVDPPGIFPIVTSASAHLVLFSCAGVLILCYGHFSQPFFI
ncbi:MAG: hypothetical protein ABRQ39_32165 [Candidatus Eremiobacterota bacterium]